MFSEHFRLNFSIFEGWKNEKNSNMANFKKMDDQDFAFLNKPLTAKEEKEFSDFLKTHKSQVKAKRIVRTESRPNKNFAFK